MTKTKLNCNLLNLLIVEQSKKEKQSYYYQLESINKHKKKNPYNIFFLEQNNKNKFPTFKFIQMFTSIYLQNIYKIDIKEKNINTINVLPRKLSRTFLFKVRNTNFKQFNIKYFNEVGYLFLLNI